MKAELFNDFSSKVKNVFIEIHNYSFFHGPSEISQSNKKFIGRKKLIRRFISIFTNSETKAGAYLITGFRGIGKTSFVNESLSQISSLHLPNILWSRIIKLLILTFLFVLASNFEDIFSFLNRININTYILIEFFIVLYFFCLAYLFRTKSDRFHTDLQRQTDSIKNEYIKKKIDKKNFSIENNVIFLQLLRKWIINYFFKKRKNKPRRIYEIIQTYYKFYIFIFNDKISQRFRLFIQDIFILISIYFVSFLIILLFYKNSIDVFIKGKIYFISFIIVVIFPNVIIKYFENVLKKTKEEIKKHNKRGNFKKIKIMRIIISGIFGFFIGSFIGFFVVKITGTQLLTRDILVKVSLFGLLFGLLFGFLNKYNVVFYFLKNFLLCFVYPIERYFKLSKNIYIKINLGHDDLKEIDILQLIAININNRYKELKDSFRKNASWLIFFFSFILLITLQISNIPFINELNNEIITKSEFCDYFPSQNRLNLVSDSNMIEKVFSKLSEQSLLTTTNFLFVLNQIFKNNENTDNKKVTKTLEALDSMNNIKLMERIDSIILKKELCDFFLTKLHFKLDDIFYDSETKRFFFDKPNKYFKTISYKSNKKDSIINYSGNINKALLIFSDATINIENSELNESVFSVLSRLKNKSCIGDSLKISRKVLPQQTVYSIYGDSIIYSDTISNKAQLYCTELFVMSPSKKVITNICNYFDLYLNVLYNRFTKFINKTVFFDIIRLPEKLNYLLILGFIMIFLSIRIIVFRSRYIGINSQRKVSVKLEDLCEMIDSEISLEKGDKAGISIKPSFMSFFNIKRKKHPIADTRQIENQLISILDRIEKLPRYIMRPDFFLIFDELDKIEPQANIEIPESEIKNQGSKISNLISPESSRKRQHAIYKLLSNLKFFLTTAKAKFVFIAGREMYDAYLADVSDRNFINRSIFNDVLYVPSFLAENDDFNVENVYNVSRMTEQYVCQFLFPKDEMPEQPSLQEYNKYLINKFPEQFDDSYMQKTEALIAKQKREKVIYLLNQFIIYLMHSSNGTPKKISNLFEKTIIKGEEYFFGKKVQEENIFVGWNEENLFLRFDRPNQYKMGMISSLIDPIVNTVSTYSKSYNDKLLVSSTFLIDHLFKFHKYAFSWRNLEHTPEVIEIHRTPELRGFITNLMQFLTQTHIEEIVSGLFQFKFPKRISQEISYLSKISEEAAATFNFTLDESLLLKQHYLDLILILENRYKNIYGGAKRDIHIHSIASLHMFLGDIYFYEENLGNAIVEYMDGIQFLRQIESEKMSVYYTVLLIRCMLKLGLAFERRKTYDSAFLKYGELCSMIINFRNIDLGELGLDICSPSNSVNETKGYDYNKQDVRFVKARKIKEKSDERFYNNIQPKDCSYYEPFSVKKNEFLNIITTNITPLKEEILFKISAIEGIRLFYQPFLAKLQIIEKSNLGGITNEDLKRTKSEFEFIQNTIQSEEKYLIEAEFWNKVGDIMYYKNGLTDSFYSHEIYDYCKNDNDQNKNNICNYCKSYNECLSCVQNRSENTVKGRKIPCVSCKYYDSSLKELLQRFINWNEPSIFQYLVSTLSFSLKEINNKDDAISLNNKLAEIKKEKPEINKTKSKRFLKSLISFVNTHNYNLTDLMHQPKISRPKDVLYFEILLSALMSKGFVSQRINSLKAMASLLSNLGDIRLSCSQPSDEISESFLDVFLKTLNSIKEINNKDANDRNNDLLEYVKEKGLSKIEAILIYYYLSSVFFIKANNFKDSSFQLIKILQVFREYVSSNNLEKSNGGNKDIDKRKELINRYIKTDDIHNGLVITIIRTLYRTYENTHNYQTEKMKNILHHFDNQESQFLKQDISLKKLPLDVELEEVIFLYQDLKLLCETDKNNKNKLLAETFNYNLASPYLTENNMFNRVIKLRFKAGQNHQILELFGFGDSYKKGWNKDLFINLISMFYCTDGNKDIEKFLENCNIELSNNSLDDNIELFEFIVIDSIYCLNEVVKAHSTFEKSYVFTHSYMALVHEELQVWINLYESYIIMRKMNHEFIGNKTEKKYFEKFVRFQFNKGNTSLKKNKIQSDIIKTIRSGFIRNSYSKFIKSIYSEITKTIYSKIKKDIESEVIKDIELVFIRKMKSKTIMEISLKTIKKIVPIVIRNIFTEIMKKIESVAINESDIIKKIEFGFIKKSENNKEKVIEINKEIVSKLLQEIESEVIMKIESKIINKIKLEANKKINFKLFINIESDLIMKIESEVNNNVESKFIKKSAFIKKRISDIIKKKRPEILIEISKQIQNKIGSGFIMKIQSEFIKKIDPKIKKNIIKEMEKSNTKQVPLKIEEKFNEVIDPDDAMFLSVIYQTEKAINENYAAIETHSEGLAYKNLIEDMYYLNDDFNDKLFHFRLAQERYRINSDLIDDRLLKLKQNYKLPRVYQHENYLKTITAKD